MLRSLLVAFKRPAIRWSRDRSLVCLAIFFSLGAAQEWAGAQDPIEADILLVGGDLHIGDGSPMHVGDLAIQGDRIVAVGDFKVASSKLTIDCKGLVVCPGFIDLHNHSDDEIVEPHTRAAMNYIMQGCTTMVTGNCGSGPIDVAGYYRWIDDHGAGTNIMHLLPQGSLRREVMGSDRREATEEELAEMLELAKQAMLDGAWGMSTGLIYVPSSYANTEELIEIARVVGKHGGIYASHIRNEGTGLLDAIDEALEIGRRASVPVHVSHFKSSGKDSWGLVRTAVEKIKQERDQGQIITADQYPYTASSTSLQATLIPAWARAGGRKKMLERMAPESPTSKRIIDAIKRKLEITDNGHRIQIASCAKHPEWAGRRLDEIAAEENVSTLELVHRIQRDGGAAIVNHSINEQDVRFVMQQDWVATASDGSAKVPNHTVPHPRNYGTFPRKIGYYALRQNALELQLAIRSSTNLPAKILGIDDRGMLAAGNFADVVVFDSAEFLDQATFEKPHQYGKGLTYVFVNGRSVVYEGQPTGVLAGRALRKGRESKAD